MNDSPANRVGNLVPTYQPMLLLLGVLAAGIALDRWATPPPWVSFGCAVVALAAWFAMRRRGRFRLANGALLLAVAMGGAAWHHAYWQMYPASDIGFFATRSMRPTIIEACVVGGPRRVPAPPVDPLRPRQIGDRTRLDLRLLALRNGKIWQPATGKAFATVEGHVLGISVGDRVRLVGSLVAPSPARNPGDFDYAEYCRSQRVLALFYCDTPQGVKLIERGSAFNPRRWIEQFRRMGHEALTQSLRPRQASLAAAMFLGVREELDPELRESFRETGTVHLLVISGLNVGILAACVLLIARFGMLSDRQALALLAGVTIGYAVLTGAQPPVLRATALVLVYCGARLLGRQPLAYNAWATAAVIILLLNPTELFQAGTQLSFLAVAALVGIGQSWLVRRQANTTESPWLASLPLRLQMLYLTVRGSLGLLLVSVVVWIVVQPLVAAQFHLFTPAAIVVGPLVSLPVTAAMASGFAVMVVGVILPPVGWVCGVVCDRALALVIAIVDIAQATPGSYWVTGGPPQWWLFVFYGMLATYAFVPVVRYMRLRWRGPVFLAWLVLGVASATWPLTERNALRATFLSVGHGLAVVLEFSNGQVWLYDAGSMHGPDGVARSAMGFLATRHVKRIDRLLISHADIDHYNGIPKLVRWFSINNANYGPRTFAEDTEPLKILQTAIIASAAQRQTVVAGDELTEAAPCRITVLSPPAGGVPGSDNANSVVLLLEYGQGRMLLTGDLETPALEWLLEQNLGPITVLLVPHHGSARSDPPGLAHWAQAQHVVISGSMADRSKSVRADYVTSGAEVHHTAETGAVEVLLRLNGELRVRHYLPNNE